MTRMPSARLPRVWPVGPPSKPIMPSPPEAPVLDSASVTSVPPVSAFAVSASVRAGTSAVADRPGCSGFQVSVRTASR